MGIGAGIFLLAVGAILVFAVHTVISAVSIQIIGIILMCAGALGILLGLLVFAPRRRAAEADTVVESERVYHDRGRAY